MLDQTNPLPGAPIAALPAPTSILQIWRMALTRPYPATYAAIAHLPQASAKAAYGWVFVAAVFEAIIASLAERWSTAMNATEQAADSTFTQNCAPAAGIVAILVFIVSTGIMHLLARALGGGATFGQFSYAIAAIQAPFTLITTALGLLSYVPGVGVVFDVLTLPLALYMAVLEIIAVMGVHGITALRAFFAACTIPLVIGCCIGLGLMMLIAAAAPEIGNSFSGFGPVP